MNHNETSVNYKKDAHDKNIIKILNIDAETLQDFKCLLSDVFEYFNPVISSIIIDYSIDYSYNQYGRGYSIYQIKYGVWDFFSIVNNKLRLKYTYVHLKNGTPYCAAYLNDTIGFVSLLTPVYNKSKEITEIKAIDKIILSKQLYIT